MSMSGSFERFAGGCAIAAGIVGFLYAVSFVVLQSVPLSALFLTLGGLLGSAVMVGLFGRLRGAEPGAALWGLVLGTAGTLGSVAHGGYDLANAINVPDTIPPNVANLPSQIDPRGLLTFGLTGMALLVAAWLIGRGGALPARLGWWGYLTGALLVVVYLARLVVLSPTNPLLLVPVLVTGFVVSPVWYVWLGLALRAEPAPAPAAAPVRAA
ncbi:MAG TPA: hypothetical protein VFC93_05620 [Chloroflexota bacterium]|nr:hypothetical protein [Chloroflexota bacterium]